MDDIIHQRWYIADKLTLQEREVLFIILEAAGFSITRIARQHEAPEVLSQIAHYGYSHITAYNKDFTMPYSTPVTYKEVIQDLRRLIKRQQDDEYKRRTVGNQRTFDNKAEGVSNVTS